MVQHRQASNQRFMGDGATAVKMRSQAWLQTSLGAIETWSPRLKTALNMLLHSSCPMFLGWGSDRIHTAVERALAEKDIYDVELRPLGADGSVHWLCSIGRARYDHDSEATYMIGAALDIPERKQNELERENLLLRERHYVSQLQGLTHAPWQLIRLFPWKRCCTL